jgi:hypothetical protein
MTHHVTLPLRKPRYLRRLKLWIWQERRDGTDLVLIGDRPPAAAPWRLACHLDAAALRDGGPAEGHDG